MVRYFEVRRIFLADMIEKISARCVLQTAETPALSANRTKLDNEADA